MNLYLLVEGKRTEAKVYPRWLSYILPMFVQVPAFDQVSRNNYYLFSAEGYPSILGTHLPNAIRDVRKIGRYDYLVVCLDADEAAWEERREEALQAAVQSGLDLGHAALKIIVQNRCIETWFLANRKVIPRHPQDDRLRSYIEFYNVRERDPEQMGVHSDFELHSPFHSAYLRSAFAEHGLLYSKSRPGHVADKAYFEQLVARAAEHPADLATFQLFLGFCEALRRQVDPPL